MKTLGLVDKKRILATESFLCAGSNGVDIDLFDLYYNYTHSYIKYTYLCLRCSIKIVKKNFIP